VTQNRSCGTLLSVRRVLAIVLLLAGAACGGAEGNRASAAGPVRTRVEDGGRLRLPTVNGRRNRAYLRGMGTLDALRARATGTGRIVTPNPAPCSPPVATERRPAS